MNTLTLIDFCMNESRNISMPLRSRIVASPQLMTAWRDHVEILRRSSIELVDLGPVSILFRKRYHGEGPLFITSLSAYRLDMSMPNIAADGIHYGPSSFPVIVGGNPKHFLQSRVRLFNKLLHLEKDEEMLVDNANTYSAPLMEDIRAGGTVAEIVGVMSLLLEAGKESELATAIKDWSIDDIINPYGVKSIKMSNRVRSAIASSVLSNRILHDNTHNNNKPHYFGRSSFVLKLVKTQITANTMEATDENAYLSSKGFVKI